MFPGFAEAFGRYRNTISPIKNLLKRLGVRIGFLALGGDRVINGWSGFVSSSEALYPAVFTQSKDLLAPEHSMSHAFNERRVWTVKGAVFDFSQGVLYLNGAGIAESTSWQPSKRIRHSPPRLIFARKLLLQRPVALASEHRWNYYHWLVEDLPGLVFLNKSVPNLSVCIGKGAPPFVGRTLEFYGIRFYVSSGLRRVPELIFVGKGQDTGWPHPWDVKQLRPEVLARTGHKKIYISRRKASRSPAYELDLENWLALRGFEIWTLEDCSFEFQVELFSKATIVISHHGAGLANVIFSPSATKVIEIFDSRFINQCYERLSTICGHLYEGLVLDGGEDFLTVVAEIDRLLGCSEADLAPI